jgi:TRAP-type C4-dicarboxylate transport system permease large subunit
VLLFVVNEPTGTSLRDMIAEISPFFAILIAALLVMTLVPETVLQLPHQLGYVG